VINAAGALISGLTFGIEMDGAGTQTVNNSGKVIGTANAGVFFSQENGGAFLNNRGFIFGGTYGVDNESINAGGAIKNFGIIKSSNLTIYVNTANNFVTPILNAATGIIDGKGGAAIYSALGMFSLDNAGKILGEIDDASGVRDVIINHGLIQGPIHLGGGNDVYNGKGGTAGHIYGDAGIDHLAGGAKADRLHGGDDNDVLTGRLGADRFFFDTTPTATNIDRITDFTPAQGDKIVLDETDFANLGPVGTLAAGHFHVGAAVGGAAQILYKPGTGFLFYDPDGTGSGNAIHFATLATHPIIHHTDFILVA
jgi:Ca2+-binding RTX toxin-like protein